VLQLLSQNLGPTVPVRVPTPAVLKSRNCTSLLSGRTFARAFNSCSLEGGALASAHDIDRGFASFRAD
jgi:hypothetical protein